MSKFSTIFARICSDCHMTTTTAVMSRESVTQPMHPTSARCIASSSAQRSGSLF